MAVQISDAQDAFFMSSAVSTPDPACVQVVHHTGWAEVILSRPDRKNAITGPMGQELAFTLDQLANDDAVNLVLLRGAGGAFCSGLDLKAFNADPKPDWLTQFPTLWRGAHRALFNFNKPIIGALERFAINGGAALAIACDLLVVGEASFLQVGEVQIGMAAPYNLAWLSLRHPESANAEITLIGDRLNGAQMLRLGLATTCVGDDQVLNEATRLAERLASYPAGALQRIKTGLRARLDHTADAWFDRFTSTSAAPPRPPASMQPTPTTGGRHA
jgi:enoyl-CoA hydratase/carnithine racemase